MCPVLSDGARFLYPTMTLHPYDCVIIDVTNKVEDACGNRKCKLISFAQYFVHNYFSNLIYAHTFVLEIILKI